MKHTKTVAAKTLLLSLNNGHLSHKSLFYKESGSFILLRDVNVMLKNDTIILPTHIILD